MVKRNFALAGVALLLAISVKAQPTTLLSFGTTTEVLNTTATGAGFGSAFSIPTQNANVLVWQLVPVGGPSAISATLQVSQDNSTWASLSTCTSTSGCIFNVGLNSYRFVRTQYTSRTGGTATQALVSVTRAYPLTSNVVAPVVGDITITPVTFATLGAPANGNMKYCSDCTIANPCAGAGTGALAKRLNGVWVCN